MATRKTDIDLSGDLVAEFGENAEYVGELLARYRIDPGSLDEEWRAFFRGRLGEPEPARSPTADKPVSGERTALRGAALRVAENMEASLAVPTATSHRQIPIKVLEENRRLANDWRETHEQPKLSFTHFISWAILRALKDSPHLNDAYDASQGGPARVVREEVRFGLAVDVAKPDGSRSLVVPNVRGAQSLTFAGFAAAADDLVARARKGKLDLKDFEGTTVSLTNPGTLGTTASVPRLMPGQGLIVATGAIEYPAEFAAMSPE
ncbi:MAG TPA: 2-oxo acid dehydrogenase subunit E2, partial [Thermoanaerobaculia bacterium]|nr:2-oxo acid dehydrogenase subunit E2 [Thermoanaerobaculia bacterium]